MRDERLTVTLSDGREELFAPGVGDIPEPWWSASENTNDWSIGVRYTVDPAGALLVGFGVDKPPVFDRTEGAFSENRTERRILGEQGMHHLHVVRAIAPGHWISVAGSGYWDRE